ncbi:hypothetical protein DLE60_21030 [Micromonospora globispora]|uniref:DUF732 domain-containing protein n=1 Tax=Micromonospora globispora TaxID=1450148 RepID=A0A317K5H7_9ACTN|nr:hypothetical protein [Micromonospora globispora]PWU46353.1 hypothetical protein DLJ46_18525 [Micromonospora globispora]PWU58563.1 hypothetical protein DLE60_21030 [Micromonospora globispora]RQW87762.1 hypothetical protein DKL51_25720 [Micromonospora globispora]
MQKSTLLTGAAVGLTVTLAGGALAFAGTDRNPDQERAAHAMRDFGVAHGLDRSSSEDITSVVSCSCGHRRRASTRSWR